MSNDATTVSRSDWRVILLASLGGALEFYDFVIYSQFAQYIGRAFFPNDDPLISLVVSFSVFAVGYFARPVGGIFFSHMGDHVLNAVIVAMARPYLISNNIVEAVAATIAELPRVRANA